MINLTKLSTAGPVPGSNICSGGVHVLLSGNNAHGCVYPCVYGVRILEKGASSGWAWDVYQ